MIFLTMKKFNELSSKVDALTSYIGAENTKEIVDTDKALREDEKMRQKVAYALNLCTVSVSQIVDYNDIYILEQEYDAILNNLNIEKFVKDEAFLKVLKQILDTITFFKIQEREKEGIEEKYQQKMRDAIWEAIPSPGIILAGGSPVTMIIGLAASFGTGYMNYRRNKSAYLLEKEEQEWQLQRAALEQFNGLRRELFEAAWRLSERYNFKDEYRLTEKQITHYNSILQDNDPLRRYERLDVVKENFNAFPPYWYYKASTAREISIRYEKSNQGIAEKYRMFAVDHYEKFSEIYTEDLELMREDLIASSCFLEHIAMLNIESDGKKIKHLLDRAVRLAGNNNDVLQQCVFHYFLLGEKESAINILRRLINEDYNVKMNGKTLSEIYIFLKDRAAYDILSNRITPQNVTDWNEGSITSNRFSRHIITNYSKIEKGSTETYREEEISLQADITCEGHLVFDHCIISYDAKNQPGKIKLMQSGSVKIKQCVIIEKNTEGKGNKKVDFFISGERYTAPSVLLENTLLDNCRYLAENVTVKMNNCIVRYSSSVTEKYIIFQNLGDNSRIENSLIENTNTVTLRKHYSLFGGIAVFSGCSFRNISFHISDKDFVSINACSFFDCSNIARSSSRLDIQDCLFEKCDNIITEGSGDLIIGYSQFIECRNTLLEHSGNSEIFCCEFYNYSYEKDNEPFRAAFDYNSTSFNQHKISDCLFDTAYFGENRYLVRCEIDKEKYGVGLQIKGCKFQNCVISPQNESIFYTQSFIKKLFGSKYVKSVSIDNDCKGINDIQKGKAAAPNTNIEIKRKTKTGVPIGANLDPNTIGVSGYYDKNGVV
ncbi:hypothetical protein AGMMS49587_13580 [Spirochaetia bacterium]|nr:hypothetical protein AGMMS49587_13580 [Spirochaetia bacterium]